jgi:hypothetical protein
VGVTGSFGGIGIVLLIVTVTTEGCSVESVGEIVITDVLTSFVDNARAGLVEVDVVAVSSVITVVLNSLMKGTGPGLVAPVVGSSVNV